MYDIATRTRVLSLLHTFSVSEVSRQTGVSCTAIRKWRDDPMVLWPKRIASCVRCENPPRQPERPDSYAYLLGLYLGDGCISPAGDRKKEVWALRIACADAWPGLITECAIAMEGVLQNKTFFQQRVGCVMVTCTSKHWRCLFPQHGAGRKHLRPIVLEPWQQAIVDMQTELFVRGLLHSDGCRFTNHVRRPLKDGDRWYEYPRYMFTNESADIRNLFGAALDHLGIAWRYSRRNTISIAKKDAVACLDAFVGPKY